MPRPDPLPRADIWRSNLLQAPLFFAATALFGTLSLAASLLDPSGRTQHRIARAWARAILAISGSTLTVRGQQNLRLPGPAVYAANHTSYMDTPVIFAAIPFQFRILARKDLWKLPFIGWYLNRSGQLPIDTDNPRASIASLSHAARTLQAGMPVFVFPEGGRTRDGRLQPFLSGAAFLAIRARVPLVPLALVGVYDLLPIGSRHFHPGPLELVAGEPIDTGGYSLRQAEELTALLRQRIEELWRQASPEDSDEPAPLAAGQ